MKQLFEVHRLRQEIFDEEIPRLCRDVRTRGDHDDSDGALFVETHRSTYRIVLDEPQGELVAPIRMRVSLDGFELTVAPANSSGDALDGAEPID